MLEPTVLNQLARDPAPAPAQTTVDVVAVFHSVITLVEEARTGAFLNVNATLLLQRPVSGYTMLGTMVSMDARPVAPPPSDALAELRGRLLIKLEALKTQLYAALSDVEASGVFAAMVFFIDETILREEAGRSWPLLQQEMFDFTDGGERFFDLVDQRLAVAQTAPLVLEIFYYLLSDSGKHKGFLGRHATHADQLAQYRRRLQERIHAPPPKPRKSLPRHRSERTRVTAALSERPLPPLAYYALALCAVVFIGLVSSWLSELPDLAATRVRAGAGAGAGAGGGDQGEEAAE